MFSQNSRGDAFVARIPRTNHGRPATLVLAPICRHPLISTTALPHRATHEKKKNKLTEGETKSHRVNHLFSICHPPHLRTKRRGGNSSPKKYVQKQSFFCRSLAATGRRGAASPFSPPLPFYYLSPAFPRISLFPKCAYARPLSVIGVHQEDLERQQRTTPSQLENNLRELPQLRAERPRKQQWKLGGNGWYGSSESLGKAAVVKSKLGKNGE